ncbi:MAG: hypothetical protein LBQ80_05545 [Clostridium sp.]|jgi:hypothetical protein|nr:hypothetical protein [Clostridium sp.]
MSEASAVTEKWHLWPPGNNINIGENLTLGSLFFNIAGLIMLIGGIVLAFLPQRELSSGGIETITTRKGSAPVLDAPAPQKRGVGEKLRWVALFVITLVLLLVGSRILGMIIRDLTGALLSGDQIDGGLVLAIPFAVFGSALFFRGTPLLERIKPFAMIAPFSLFVLKIGCFIEQINFGKPVSWGIPVYKYSDPVYAYNDPEVRIFPYNLFILTFMLIASIAVVTRQKSGKPYLCAPFLLYGATFFIDFFLGRDVGPRPLGISVIGFCHLIILAWGVYILVLEQRRWQKIKEEQAKLKRKAKRKKK